MQEARERIIESYEPDVCDAWHRQLRYAYGEPWTESEGAVGHGGSQADDEITDYPDITMHLSEAGRAKSILATQFNAVARIMNQMPRPRYTQIDKMTQLGRQQVFMARFTGDGLNHGHWGNELDSSFLYGNGVGMGHVRIGLEDNKATGKARVDIKHYPPFQVVLDRHAINKQRSTFVAFVDYLSRSEAYAMFGKTVADRWISTRWGASGEIAHGRGSNVLHAMRVVHYFDLGFGGGDPTHICFPGSIHEDPLVREPSDFWRVLPHCTYTHFQPSGMRYPVGQIGLQMASQEMLNVCYRNLRSAMTSGRGIDIMDETLIDDEDSEKWHNGEFITKLRANGTPEKGQTFLRIPPMQVDQHVLALIGIMQQQFNTDSSQTSWDLNNMNQDSRSATENMLLSQRSGAGASWQKRQIAHFYIDLFDKLGRIMGEYDRDPVMVDINTFNVLLNDPKDPNSWLDNWFAEPSDIVIDYNEINLDEVEQKRERDMMMLQSIGQIAMQVNPMKYVYETLKAAGFAPEEWMPPEMMQMALMPSVMAMQGASPAGQAIAPMLGGGPTSPAPAGQGPSSGGGEAKKALKGGPQPYATPA